MVRTDRMVENREFEVYDYRVVKRQTQRNKKISSLMAMLLGILVTLEIMVAGAMMFHIDVHAADTLGLIFGFVVLYFGVVFILTDR